MLIRTLHQKAFESPRPAPRHLAWDECRALSAGERRQRAEDVLLWLRAQYIPSARDEEVMSGLEDLIHRNLVSPLGTTDLAIVTGDNVLGKSTLIERAAAMWHREAVGDDCDPLVLPSWVSPAGVTAHYEPVVALSLRGGATTRVFLDSLAEAMDYPRTARVSPARLFFDHGTRILVVDDVHFLIKSEKKGEAVLQEIKYICTALGELGGTVILVGANLDDHPLMEDPQVTGRSQPPFRFTPYRLDTEEQMRSWIALLKEIERLISPYLPAGHPGMIFKEAAGLTHQRSRGRMRDLVHLIFGAVEAAIRDGSFQVTTGHLMAVPLSERSRQEDRYGISKTTRSKPPRAAGDQRRASA